MKKEPTYTWDEKEGIATYTIHYNNREFTGKAICHTDDQDMKSEMTGISIANLRASILYFQHVRDCEIKPALAALKQLYYSMAHSKKFNKKSYETKMLYRQIQNYTFDLDTINKTIAVLKKNLYEFLIEKEHFYQIIRSKRQKGQK